MEVLCRLDDDVKTGDDWCTWVMLTIYGWNIPHLDNDDDVIKFQVCVCAWWRIFPTWILL